MLTLDKRLCDLGGDQSSKVRDKNGEKVRSLTFQIESFPLDERELCAFLRDPAAWRWMYSDTNGEIVPIQRCFKAHEMAKPVDNAYVEISYGLDGRVAFADCKLSKIKLAAQDGGETMLSCKVTTQPILDETLAELFERFGSKVEVEIRGEPPGAQQDLPLNQHGEGEQPAKKRRGRRGNGESRAH
jgi:hypothetical protein